MTWFVNNNDRILYSLYGLYNQGSYQLTYGNVPTNMTVEVQKVIQERYVIPMVCSRCKHFWGYTGTNNYVVTCPRCRTKLSIKKNSRVPSQTGLRVVEALNQSTKVIQSTVNEEGESHAD